MARTQANPLRGMSVLKLDLNQLANRPWRRAGTGEAKGEVGEMRSSGPELTAMARKEDALTYQTSQYLGAFKESKG